MPLMCAHVILSSPHSRSRVYVCTVDPRPRESTRAGPTGTGGPRAAGQRQSHLTPLRPPLPDSRSPAPCRHPRPARKASTDGGRIAATAAGAGEVTGHRGAVRAIRIERERRAPQLPRLPRLALRGPLLLPARGGRGLLGGLPPPRRRGARGRPPPPPSPTPRYGPSMGRSKSL